MSNKSQSGTYQRAGTLRPDGRTIKIIGNGAGGSLVGVPDLGDATELQGVPVSPTPPTEGQILVYNGSEWVPGVTPGTAGDVITSNGVLELPSYQPAAGGGGTGLFAPVMSAIPTTATLPDAYNNSGTFSQSDSPQGVLIVETVGQGVGTSLLEGIVKAYPATPFTAKLLLSIPQITSTFCQMGLGITTDLTGTGPAQLLGLRYSGTAWQPVVTNWSSGSSFNSYAAGPLTAGILPQYLWLMYEDDGTNITQSISSDGSAWQQVLQVARTAGFMAGNYNYLGVLIQQVTIGAWLSLLSYSD